MGITTLWDGEIWGGGQPAREQPPQIISAQIRGGRKAGFILGARGLPFPSRLELCCTSKASGPDPSPGAGGRAAAPPCVWGHGGYQTIVPKVASPVSLPTWKTGSRGAIIEETVDREGFSGAPHSVFIFPAATTFPHVSLLFLYSHIPIPFPCTHSLSPHSRCCFIFPFLFFLPRMLLLPTFSPCSSLCFHMLRGKHHLLPYFFCFILAALCCCSLRLFSISSHLSCSHPLLLVISFAAEWPRKPIRQRLPLSSHLHKVPHQDLVPAPAPL